MLGSGSFLRSFRCVNQLWVLMWKQHGRYRDCVFYFVWALKHAVSCDAVSDLSQTSCYTSTFSKKQKILLYQTCYQSFGPKLTWTNKKFPTSNKTFYFCPPCFGWKVVCQHFFTISKMLFRFNKGSVKSVLKGTTAWNFLARQFPRDAKRSATTLLTNTLSPCLLRKTILTQIQTAG